MHDTPLVSILIPNYNKAPYLRETLDSVLAQTYPHWECIIVDDHSTDDSWEILEEYAQKDFRFKIFKRPEKLKKGGSICRNVAFEYSSGQFIQWLDSDDVLDQRKIEIQLNELDNLTKESVVSVSNWAYFADNPSDTMLDFNRWTNYPQQATEALVRLWTDKSFFPIFTFLIPTSVVHSAGRWDETILKNQDGEYTTRVVLAAQMISYSNIAMGYYRKADLTHVSAQKSFSVSESFLHSLEKCEMNILACHDNLKVRRAVALNYEFFFTKYYDKFPNLAERALKNIIRVKGPQSMVRGGIPIILRLTYLFGFVSVYYMRKFLKNVIYAKT